MRWSKFGGSVSGRGAGGSGKCCPNDFVGGSAKKTLGSGGTYCCFVDSTT